MQTLKNINVIYSQIKLRSSKRIYVCFYVLNIIFINLKSYFNISCLK